MVHFLHHVSQDVASVEFRMIADDLFQIRVPMPILPENIHGFFGGTA